MGLALEEAGGAERVHGEHGNEAQRVNGAGRNGRAKPFCQSALPHPGEFFRRRTWNSRQIRKITSPNRSEQTGLLRFSHELLPLLVADRFLEPVPDRSGGLLRRRILPVNRPERLIARLRHRERMALRFHRANFEMIVTTPEIPFH
ncbi:MAG: hypothetical protein CMO55_16995 [Verrucomicrobiales bacterium]|nr:hypothetical protein [Verrucomicrobiales bacterium]